MGKTTLDGDDSSLSTMWSSVLEFLGERRLERVRMGMRREAGKPPPECEDMVEVPKLRRLGRLKTAWTPRAVLRATDASEGRESSLVLL